MLHRMPATGLRSRGGNAVGIGADGKNEEEN